MPHCIWDSYCYSPISVWDIFYGVIRATNLKCVKLSSAFAQVPHFCIVCKDIPRLLSFGVGISIYMLPLTLLVLY